MITTVQKVSSRLLVIGAAILLQVSSVAAQTYTLAPLPIQRITTNANGIIPNGCIWTYAAGTTSPIATYADSGGTPNGNPIIADNYGFFVAYLLPGTTYKFQYESTPCNAPSTHGTIIKVQDNIAAVPASAATVDVIGTAGESLTAGQAAYLSDGSGGKTAGQWYKADSANTYSSTLNWVGMVPASITSASSGTIRIAGSVTGLTVTIGTKYYVGTAGAITSTAPANARLLGETDSVASIVLNGNPPAAGVFTPATMTNHGVVLGQGTSTVVATAAGTTGQLLVATTSADPAFAGASASGASMVLLKSNSGTDTSAGATNVDTIAISGLTAKDTLLIKVRAISVTQATANFQLYNNTDGVQLYNMVNPLTAGATWVATADMGQSQASGTSINTLSTGFLTGASAFTSAVVAAVTQNWTGSWTLALRHTGVTAGGTLQWAWSVYKLSGQ